jgi:CBS domain-containing protein
MRIKDRLEASPMPEPLTVGPDQTVAEAVARMADKNYGSAIVVSPERKVIGIITERDILNRLVNPGRHAKETKVSEIMTANPHLANENDEIVTWMRVMTKERFRRLPVVDDNDHIKAVVTQTDIVSYTWPRLIEQATELTKTSVKRSYQVLLIVGGVALYSLALVGILVNV